MFFCFHQIHPQVLGRIFHKIWLGPKFLEEFIPLSLTLTPLIAFAILFILEDPES